MITVTDLRGALRLRPQPGEGVRWLFLGKSVKARLGLERRWNLPPITLDHELQAKAQALRRPYLDFVAALGKGQSDPLTWWSTRFSWKIGTASDFFLLVCLQAVALTLIDSSLREGRTLWLVVEDPWLLRQIKANLRMAKRPVRVHAGSALLRNQLGCAVSGVLRRSKWLAGLWWAWLRQKSLWPRAGTFGLPGPTAAIFSPPQARSLLPGGGWRDPYLPDLDGWLREVGYRALRFCLPQANGFERALAERAAYARPLILYATPRALWLSLLAFWKPRWPGRAQIAGRSVDFLCRREWWRELGLAGISSYRLFYECFCRFLKMEKVNLVVTFFENQPWEKLAAVAVRAHGARLVGIQTSAISRFSLSYFLGAGEADRMPLPDAICTSGAASQRLLQEGSHPPSRLALCGSLRYRNLHPDNGFRKLPPASRREILVILSFDPTLSLHLLSAIGAAFPDGGRSRGLSFHVRAHPACPIRNTQVEFPARINNPPGCPLEEDLRRCGTVLFANSTAGLEALAHGRAVVRFRSQWLIDWDEWWGPEVLVCTEETLRDSLAALVEGSDQDPDGLRLQPFVSQHLAPLREDQLKMILTGEAPC
jgi:hypothetical protein